MTIKKTENKDKKIRINKDNQDIMSHVCKKGKRQHWQKQRLRLKMISKKRSKIEMM